MNGLQNSQNLGLLGRFQFGMAGIRGRIPTRQQVSSGISHGLHVLMQDHFDPSRSLRAEPKIPQNLGEAKEQARRYSPDPTKIRNLPGECQEIPSEGVRFLNHFILEDPEFQALHTHEGRVDIHQPIGFKRTIEALQYLTDVELTELKSDGSEVGLKNELTDDEIKTVLRFFGEEPSEESPEAWEAYLRWGRAGWEGKVLLGKDGQPTLYKTDNDDVQLDGFNPHPSKLMSWRFFGAAGQALIHYTLGFGFMRRIGSIEFLVQYRPKAFEIMRVLRIGKTLPMHTDGFSGNIFRQMSDHPATRFVLAGLLPYQKPELNRDVRHNLRIFTSKQHSEQVRKYYEYLKDKSDFEKMGEREKRIIAMLVCGKKGYKTKIGGIDINPGESEGRFDDALVFVDNSQHHTMSHVRMGKSAVAVYDRHMSAAQNYATPDPLYPIMIWSRWIGETVAEQVNRVNSFGQQRLGAGILMDPDNQPMPLADVILAGAQAMIDWTGNFGRLNNLPHAKYGMTDDLLTAFSDLDQSAINKAALVDHNPSVADSFRALLRNLFWGRTRENGKAHYLRVQRSDHTLPFEEVYLSYESDVDAAKQLVKDIRRYLRKNGELQAVRAYHEAMMRETVNIIKPVPA
jgi:hypothetical protein